MHKGRLIVSGLVFLLLALGHLYRIISPFPVVVGNNALPEAASYIGFVVFGLLALWDLLGSCGCCCGCKGSCGCKSKHGNGNGNKY